MRSLALIGPGPTWTDGRPVFDQDPHVLHEHLDHMRRLFDSGALLGGPAYDRRSGIALLETPNHWDGVAAPTSTGRSRQ